MRRRDFITFIGGAAAAPSILWPLAARAQQPAIGWLNTTSAGAYADFVRAFHRGLSETGYVEGQNVTVDYRWAESHLDRLPALAADLVRRQVSVICANGVPSTTAAKAATTTIPIVFVMGADPVAFGLVASLNRPGGNVTGATPLALELTVKRLELLHELVPAATIISLLVNPTHPAAETVTRNTQAAASTLGLQLRVLYASTERDFDAAFATIAELRVGGLVIANEGLFNSRNEQLAALAARYRVPAIHIEREFAAAGGLMSYGASIADSWRLVGTYTGRILKGEKPADLPVQQSTKIELHINMKTAKALGLTFPTALLVRADKVIE
jgi:putative tryptophan/tyrosine transport system substrate-binding protein